MQNSLLFLLRGFNWRKQSMSIRLKNCHLIETREYIYLHHNVICEHTFANKYHSKYKIIRSRIRDRSLGCQEKPDALCVSLSEIVTHYSRSQTFSHLFVSTLSSFPSPTSRRRRNCRRNISASNVARLIRKVKRNIRNYDTHFSRTGRNNEEKTAQLVTTYCTINGTARLRALYVYVYVFAVLHRPRNFRSIWKSHILLANSTRHRSNLKKILIYVI